MLIAILVTYYIIGTIILINLIFNPNIKLEMENKKTKKVRKPTSTDLIFFTLFWIVVFPMSVLKSKERNMKENDK